VLQQHQHLLYLVGKVGNEYASYIYISVGSMGMGE
jgi:hypothetical protein